MSENLFESKKIDAFHKKLNSKEYSPNHGYRRNVRVYTLLCYINNIIGCYLSYNEDPIPIFIGRSRKHMNVLPINEEWSEYYEMVTKYLDTVESHFKKHGVNITSIYNYRNKDII
jgi:hypothetical protein